MRRAAVVLAFSMLVVPSAIAQQSPDSATIRVPPFAEWIAKWRAAPAAERAAMVASLPSGSASFPDPEARHEITQLLDDPDAAVRELACELLRYDSDDAKELVPRLAQLVKDPQPRVRFVAASVLAHLAWGVETHGPSFQLAMDELIGFARGDDVDLRREALQYLTSFGRVEPRLVALYSGLVSADDVGLRRIAANGLGTSLGKYEDARAPLHTALADTDSTVRMYAARALVFAGENSDEIASVLIGIAADPEASVRMEVMTNLGNLGVERSKETLPILVAGLRDPSASVRGNAAGALGGLGSDDGVEAPDAVPLLVGLTKDPNATVRGAAAFALGHVGASAEDAVPALAGLLQDPEPETRGYAVDSLKQAGEEIVLALPSLIEALDAVAPVVRRSSAELIALGGARSKNAVDALVARLADPVATVRVWSAYALRSIGPDAATAVPRLAQMLGSDPDPKARVEAARALAAYGALSGAAADALVAACADPDVDVRLWSLFALGETKVTSDAARAALDAAAKSNDPRVVVEANKALASLGAAHDEKVVANAAETPAPSEPLSAPIAYDGLALVLVDAKGVAIVVFDGETLETTAGAERRGVKYRYRYFAKGQERATDGAGEAFALRRSSSSGSFEDVAASHSAIDAGPLRVAWSQRGTGSGYVYWRPESMTVTLAPAYAFETIDLRRFMRCEGEGH
jgi:HEAT repeat protein